MLPVTLRRIELYQLHIRHTCAGEAVALIARLTSTVVASFSVSAVGICIAVMLTFNTLINV